MDHGIYAAELFLQGYNCAQAVAIAFGDVTGLDEKTAARSVSAFGGGMGRLREVCGAVSGMFSVVSLLYGYDRPDDDGEKKQKRSCEICGAREIREVPITEKLLEFFKDNILFFVLGAAATAVIITVISVLKKKAKN